jgi:hypothetical protein
LLLLRENGVEKIKLIDNNQDILQELVVENDLKSLFQDCFGNVHVLNDDSAYQLQVDTKHLYIEFKCSLKKFSDVLKPCVIEIDTLLLFKKFGLHNQSIAYFYYKNNKRRYLKIIRNISREEQASQEILANKHLESILEKGPPDAGLMGEYKFFDSIGRLLFQGNNMYNKILTKPLYSPLFKINTNLYIFDHPNNNCYTFDENLKLKTTIPIDYHLQKKWAKQLIVDKEQGAVYARFEKNGFCYLKKIDLTTGKIIERYKLEKHTFPSKIKIKNNTAYYLYKDRFNHGQMSLFKQSLH